MSNEIATIQPQQTVATLETFALDAERVMARKAMLNAVMNKVMREDTHYGKIPGCGDKPTLLKPGAEAIASTFQLCPRYSITRTELHNGHREYEVTCELYNPAGGFIGSGVGSATTMEGKYRFRKADQTCPECGKEGTIIKGKRQYGGGWVCYAKKGGCGAKFPDGDPRIENQNLGRVEHDNPADYYNTVLKMGKKRAFVDAVLTATGASDIFTQDIEDMPEVIPGAGGQPNAYHSPEPQCQQPAATSRMDDLPPDFGGDPGPAAQQQAPAPNGGHRPATDAQRKKVFAVCHERRIDLNDLCRTLSEQNSFGHQVMRVNDLSGEELSDVIGWLENGALDFLAKQQAA